MLLDKQITNVDITRDDLVNLFGHIINCEFLRCKIPESLKYISNSDYFEEIAADILLSGRSVYFVDFENDFEQADLNPKVIYGEAQNNSLISKPIEFRKFLNPWDDTYFYCPVYEVNLERIKTAITEILEDKMTGDYQQCVKRSMQNIIDENDDVIDGENFWQYVVFGDAIYG